MLVLRPTEPWGFFRGPERRKDVGAGGEALHRPGGGRARGAHVGAGDARRNGRPEVLRPARHVAARLAADQRLRRVGVRGRARLRRLVHPRLAGDLRERHAADARRVERDPRPRDGGADPLTREPYAKDPRYVAQKAEAYLRGSGIADTAYFGPECEFFVFDEVSYELGPNRSHYLVDSSEGHWNSGKPGLGYTVREKEGYFPPAPHDTLSDLRTQMVLTLERLGIPCEFHHHEVASGGQCEIDLRYQTLTRMADQVMTYKYVVRNVARAHGKTATFMPKPLFGDNGSGMHTHQSLWLKGTPLMADKSGYAGLSQLARSYLAGLLDHAPALLAFCAPTTNSYRRLVPGYEAPVNLVYSQRNRSACIRIPMYSDSPKAKRIEFRCPDATANPYLAFAAMLMAGIALGGARLPRVRPHVPDPRRRLQRRPHPHVDRVQARERGGRRPPAAAPGRVRALLRRVDPNGHRGLTPVSKKV